MAPSFHSFVFFFVLVRGTARHKHAWFTFLNTSLFLPKVLSRFESYRFCFACFLASRATQCQTARYASEYAARACRYCPMTPDCLQGMPVRSAADCRPRWLSITQAVDVGRIESNPEVKTSKSELGITLNIALRHISPTNKPKLASTAASTCAVTWK